MAGTAWYLAPEQESKKPARMGPVDMWAAGCTLLELVLGKRLGGPLWRDDDETRERRTGLVSRASAKDAVLGAAAFALLQVAPATRPSAIQVLYALDPPPAFALELHPREEEAERRRKEDEERREKAAAAGVEAFEKMKAVEDLDTFVGLMKEHTGSAEVQEHGCLGLADSCRRVEDKIKVLELGGIEAVLVGMDAHKDAEKVQGAGCMALGNLSNVDKVKVAELGGIEAVLAGMDSYKDCMQVQCLGCMALRMICDGNADNKVKIAALGGVEAVLAASVILYTDSQGVPYVLLALGMICVGNADNQDKVAALGGIEIVLAEMDEYKNDANIQGYGCKALGFICHDNANVVKRMTALGTVREVVERAMADHPANRNEWTVTVQRCGKEVLDQLAK